MDELRVRQDSVMAEACNASFQVHLQVSAGRVRQHVQRRPRLLAGPVARLRNELTRCSSASGCGPRLASRCSSNRSTPAAPATTCATAAPASRSATDWVHESIAELYKEDITRFRPVLVAGRL